MSEKDGPAFPYNHGDYTWSGMSYRQWLDGEALAGVLANPKLMDALSTIGAQEPKRSVSLAVRIAIAHVDEMLRARETQDD